jgi:hypothetical protein
MATPLVPRCTACDCSSVPCPSRYSILSFLLLVSLDPWLSGGFPMCMQVGMVCKCLCMEYVCAACLCTHAAWNLLFAALPQTESTYAPQELLVCKAHIAWYHTLMYIVPRVLHLACCMLPIVCCMVHTVWCMLHAMCHTVHTECFMMHIAAICCTVCVTYRISYSV